MTNTRTIGDAIAITTAWISSSNLQFSSAFIGGSVAYADEGATYDPASDVDCYLVIHGDPPQGKIGKIMVEGVLLDVSWIPWSALENGEKDAVLSSLVNFGRVVRDDGKLGALQKRIQGRFTTPGAITERLESMRERIRNGLAGDSSGLPHPEQVMNWLFPATLATHIPLISACRPLTVRKRFLAARDVMDPNAYETLLTLYGFDDVTREHAQDWLDATARLFDATADIAMQSSRFWATDIQSDARHIAIDATQALVDSGNHREALYWILATSSRCLVVRDDAEASSEDFLEDYRRMVRALRLETAEDRRGKARAILTWIQQDSTAY